MPDVGLRKLWPSEASDWRSNLPFGEIIELQFWHKSRSAISSVGGPQAVVLVWLLTLFSVSQRKLRYRGGPGSRPHSLLARYGCNSLNGKRIYTSITMEVDLETLQMPLLYHKLCGSV